MSISQITEINAKDIELLHNEEYFRNENHLIDGISQLHHKIMDGGPSGITAPNNIMPAGILTSLAPSLVETVTRKRTAEDVIGVRSVKLEWEDETTLVSIFEKLGETKPYNDFDNGVATSGNLDYISRGHYPFSSTAQIGERTAAQLAKSRISASQYYNATLEALAIDFNIFAFEGVASTLNSPYPVYGILNEPSLPPFEDVGFTLKDYDFAKVYEALKNMISTLISQAKGYLDPQSDYTFSIANSCNKILTVVNPLGTTTLLMQLKQTYPNIKFVYSPELDKGYGSAGSELPVIYLRGEVSGVANVENSAEIMYSVIAKAHRVITDSTSTYQKISSGTAGVVVNRPYFFVRRYITSGN